MTTSPLPPNFVTTDVEYAWIVTVQYMAPFPSNDAIAESFGVEPASRLRTSTRMGVINATPGDTTRAKLFNRIIGQVKSELGAPSAVITFAYLEPNQL